MKLPNFPREIMLEPTNTCNAACPLCPTGIGALSRAKGLMDEALFQRIVDEASPHGSKLILWNYGEPFLHPKIFDMIEYASQRGLRVICSTNGYAVYKERFITRLLTSGLDTLIVCIDGATEEVNAMYRRNISLERVLTGLRELKRLRKRGAPQRIIIQTIMMKHNEHQIEDLRRLAREVSDQFQIKSVNLNMVPDVDFEEYLPTDPRYRRYTQDTNGEWGLRQRVPNTCSFIAKAFVINWDGTVNPCCWDYQGEYIIGDITKKSIREVWEGHHLRELREAIRRDRASIPMCATCPVDVKPEISDRQVHDLAAAVSLAKAAVAKINER